MVLSRRLQQAMTRAAGRHGPVELAMRYGEPSHRACCRVWPARASSKVTLAPLYPQFADSTVTTVIEEAKARGARAEADVATVDAAAVLRSAGVPRRPGGQCQAVPGAGLRSPAAEFPRFARAPPDASSTLPAQHCFKNDDCCKNASPEVLATCYRAQCLRSRVPFAKRMGLPEGKWSVSFQSRLGRAKWIEPYTEARLDELARQGVKKLLVMCPAFVADCIETLEEIGDRGTRAVPRGGRARSWCWCRASMMTRSGRRR